MLTLHYGSPSGYPSSGDNNTYLDYATLSNMSTTSDRLSECKSPMAQVVNSSNHHSLTDPSAYGYYDSSLDVNAGSGASYGGGQPSLDYNQQSGSKSPRANHYEYALQGSNQQPDHCYSPAATSEQLPPLVPAQPHLHQITVTIGPGTTQQRTLPVIYEPMQAPKDSYGSYLSIVEQPTNRIRYRYRSEKGSHGGLNGENSSQMKKTYPTVKVENHRQSSPIYIRASLATNEDKPKQHVHKLMGRHCSEDGACTLPVSDNMTTIFQNLGILFIGKKEVPEILFKRKQADLQSRYFAQAMTEKTKENLREISEKEAKDMNLNSVKICFEAFVLQNDALYPICGPVYSRPIANQKSPDSGELKIIRINRYCGTVTGGDEIYLLCEKVNKKEIRVRFFEVDSEGNQQWEAFGHFNESDVHHQVAIVFRTPPYRDQAISKPAQVYLQLYRQRDGEFSEARTFIYKPKSAHDSSEFGLGDSLSSKSGIQECVLTRIKIENQPPGFKRRKYSHQQSGTSGRIGKTGANGQATTGRTNVATSDGTSYLQRRSANRQRNNVTVKVQAGQASQQPQITIKTESSDAQHELCPLSISTSQAPNSSNVYSLRNNSGQIQASFCQSSKMTYMSPHSACNKSSLPVSRPLSSLMLPSPNSQSCSPSSPSSPSSSGSLMLATALQNTMLDGTPPSNQQQPQHQSDSLDFDHLDSMWTPPSEPSPPLSVGDFFHNFVPMHSLSPNPSVHSACSVSPSSSRHQTGHQSVTFLGICSQEQHQSQSVGLVSHPTGNTNSLSLGSLEVVPSISLSPPLSTPSPSLSSTTSCTSSSPIRLTSEHQHGQQFGHNSSICMLYS